ncbi:hypothetical protein [Methanocaldococcus infernus]
MKKLIIMFLLFLAFQATLAENFYVDLTPKTCSLGDQVYLILKIPEGLEDIKIKIISEKVNFSDQYIYIPKTQKEMDKVIVGKATEEGTGEVYVTILYFKNGSSFIGTYRFSINIVGSKEKSLVKENKTEEKVEKNEKIEESNITVNNTLINNKNNKTKPINKSEVNLTGKLNITIKTEENYKEVGGSWNYIIYAILGLISGGIFGYLLGYVINIKA